MIQFVILGLFIFLFAALYNFFSRKKKNIESIKNEKSSLLSTFYQYFFSGIGKGNKRLLIVGSCIIPLLVGMILYFKSVEEYEYADRVSIYYDDTFLIVGFIISYIIYWLVYFVFVWVQKGFKEDKNKNSNST